MEPHDLELIQRYGEKDELLSKLWQEHQVFERQLTKLESKPFLTIEEQTERNRLKKLKLVGRDKIEAILSRYRASIQAKSHAG